MSFSYASRWFGLVLRGVLHQYWRSSTVNDPISASQIRRVLIVRLDELGDVAMTTPLLRELRRNLPGGWLTLIVKPDLKNLMELCPYVDEVLTYDWRRNRPFAPLWQYGRVINLARRHLWRRRFDLAILPRWDTDAYLGTHLLNWSGARWRLAYSERVSPVKSVRNKGFNRLLTHVLEGGGLKHEVQRNTDVIRFLGGAVAHEQLELWTSKEDETFADRVLESFRVANGEPLFAFAPSGGHSPLKQWPARNFARMGLYLRERFGGRLLIFGEDGEKELGREFEVSLGDSAIDLIGKTTLRQMAALLKRCRLFIGNDAGPMHVASAMNVPVVALFGSSCAHRFSPWNGPHQIINLELPCAPCFQSGHPDRCVSCIFDEPRCMLELTVERVAKAVEELMSDQYRQAPVVLHHAGPG
jgi:heptosyltransferase-2